MSSSSKTRNVSPVPVVTATILGVAIPCAYALYQNYKSSMAGFVSNIIAKYAFPYFDKHSLVGVGPYDNASLLPALQDALETNYSTISEEVDDKIIPHLDKLYTLNRHVQSLPNHDGGDIPLDRKAYFFTIFGHDFTKSRHYCPKTSAILDCIPNIRVAFVSILAPKTKITLHAGTWNKGLVRCHLGLSIPPKCRLEVGGIAENWNEGSVVCFDETIPHQAWNESTNYRVVLIVDVVRPQTFPFNVINWLYLTLVVQTTRIQQGLADIIAWEDEFYKTMA